MSNKALNLQRMEETKKRLINAAIEPRDDVLEYYHNTFDGFEDEDIIEEMREEYGANILTKQKKASIFVELFHAFVDPFTIVLFVLASINFYTEVIAAENSDYSSVIIVMTLVVISGTLRFIQERRSNSAAEKLTEMVETTVTVNRQPEGRQEIPLDELVVGDVLYLSAGDMIPADLRIINAKDLFISQASLTGESEPIEKFAVKWDEELNNPLDSDNLAFMGTNVVSGSATAVAIAVGDDTIYGTIAKQLTGKKETTSFEEGVNSVSWVLIRFMLIMVPIVFVVNGLTKGNWMDALMFALSVAVGLTPEMLPMIVTTNLAKGAVSMAKHKVIVKDVNSIQNFGAMDILCTDKTGTITQDKVILEYYLDIEGNEDERILRHAILNSYFQTGLKNLMDTAIIAHADDEGMEDLLDRYKKVDEIPFDFNRRRMSVVVKDEKGKIQIITKGAIEEMLEVSDYAEIKGKAVRITPKLKEHILALAQEYNEDGMRVLGIAQKNRIKTKVGNISVADESKMVLIGFLTFLDPPKESAAKAITALDEYGVTVKVLTGDNDAVTRCVCGQVGLDVDEILLGSDVEAMNDKQLAKAVDRYDVFAKLSPLQKSRIVRALRIKGHVVGFLGDGINDAAAMKIADVGISVDTAVDIAKESANIILLEKDLMVLEEGVREGRKVYANIIKYIKMTASSNFGNMFSVLVASAFIPFLPMLPIHILVLNLIYDISCIMIPWDNVDEDYLRKPRKWDASSISKFMIWLGPSSSIFDIITYVVMFLVICPLVTGGSYSSLSGNSEALALFIALFHSGWFIESLWTQTLVIHLIRSPKIPFIQSRASFQVVTLTTLGILIGTVLPYTPIGGALQFVKLPAIYFAFLLAVLICYLLLVSLIKALFIRKYKELL